MHFVHIQTLEAKLCRGEITLSAELQAYCSFSVDSQENS